MKSKKEKSLEMAIDLIKATKGKKNTSMLLTEVFDKIEKITGNRQG